MVVGFLCVLVGCEIPPRPVPGLLQSVPGLQFADDVHETALTMRSVNDKMACVGANAVRADMVVKPSKAKVVPTGIKAHAPPTAEADAGALNFNHACPDCQLPSPSKHVCVHVCVCVCTHTRACAHTHALFTLLFMIYIAY